MNKQVVATIKDASQEEPQTIDLREMSIEDLLSLKTTDPFMYKSILFNGDFYVCRQEAKVRIIVRTSKDV